MSGDVKVEITTEDTRFSCIFQPDDYVNVHENMVHQDRLMIEVHENFGKDNHAHAVVGITHDQAERLMFALADWLQEEL